MTKQNIVDQSEKEFIRLTEENSGIIHKVIQLYIDSSDDRADLYQEVLCQAWKSFRNFKGASKFSTWLYRVSLNTVLTFKRKEKKAASIDVNELRPDTSGNHENELSDRLYAAVRALSEVDRMIISLHLDGYKNPEIGEITGLKPNHINVKLHRIKAILTQKLNP